jgi:hypothetical protein
MIAIDCGGNSDRSDGIQSIEMGVCVLVGPDVTIAISASVGVGVWTIAGVGVATACVPVGVRVGVFVGVGIGVDVSIGAGVGVAKKTWKISPSRTLNNPHVATMILPSARMMTTLALEL